MNFVAAVPPVRASVRATLGQRGLYTDRKPCQLLYLGEARRLGSAGLTSQRAGNGCSLPWTVLYAEEPVN